MTDSSIEFQSIKNSLQQSISEMNKVKADLFNENIDVKKLVLETKNMHKQLTQTCTRLVKFSGEQCGEVHKRFDLALEELSDCSDGTISDSRLKADLDQIQSEFRETIQAVRETINTMFFEWKESALNQVKIAEAREQLSLPKIKEIGLELALFIKPLTMDLIPFSGIGLQIVNYLAMVDTEAYFASRFSEPIRRERCKDILARSILQLDMTVVYVRFTFAMGTQFVEGLKMLGKFPDQKVSAKNSIRFKKRKRSRKK